MSIFSQWKESTPNPNKVSKNGVKTPTTKDESLKPKHVEIPKKEELLETKHAEISMVEESLTEIIENHEDEGMELKVLDHELLFDDDDVHRPSEVVFPFPFNVVIPILHTSPTLVFVPLKFQNLYHVSLREEKEQMRVKNKSAKKNMKGEIKQSGTKRVTEVVRGKKRKKFKKRKATEGEMVCS